MSAVPKDQLSPSRADVLVVGAGPAGAAAATWAARGGHSVVLVDMADFPRDKTCGDGLTPRAVLELEKLGLVDWLDEHPRTLGVHVHGWGRDHQVEWSQKGAFPTYGSAIPRKEFDEKIRGLALDAGVTMVSGAKAVDAVVDDGRVDSVTLQRGETTWDVSVGRLIVADGVRSGLGKVLGRVWHRDTVFGTAVRSYIRVDAQWDWLVTHFDMKDRAGETLPGYGWMFPLGPGPDGGALLNMGVAAFSTARRPARVQLRPLLDQYVSEMRDEWGLIGEPMQAKSALLPLGGAVSNIAGRNWMLVGDAAGCVNPMTGEGIDYALETGRLAADLLGSPDFTEIWPDLLDDHYGQAFSGLRRLATIFFHPRATAAVASRFMAWDKGMRGGVRLMNNLVGEHERDDAAVLARAVGKVSLLADRRGQRPFR
ncbi:putative oxidoreductase [Gordonia effusa NBRC 100432]|uniref:Putative oxidoreductase n=1 Tax=Gordonia effusa NBRC 100432 TaxID=1077974 RepID=H0QWE8_9ACTN|nr:geranylgeranyl reductase family protein [Gordonia effusa]GAB17149.1 putative oxidoreductase [Gordonia effusa NBRC 100432]